MREIRLGHFEIGPGAFLAPMAGITNPPFRELCRELGASLTVTELIAAQALVYMAKKPGHRNKTFGRTTLALIERYPGESPFAVQIFGREPELMAEAARIVEAEGADLVDLNFGCPARKVVKNGEGCGVALMRDPELLERVARAVVSAVSIPVTAKMRLGWSREEMNGVEVAKRLENAGVQLITVHARTREQIHWGPVDLDALAEIVRAVSLPVVGNGGIRSKVDADEVFARSGVARVAVGQGSKGNPWIFAELLGHPSTVTLADRVATCRCHLELYARWIGEARAVVEMRKHACWYLKGFAGAAALRGRLNEAVDPASFGGLLDEALALDAAAGAKA